MEILFRKLLLLVDASMRDQNSWQLIYPLRQKHRSGLEYCLPCVEPLRVAAGGVRLHAPDPHEAQEGFPVEPSLGALRCKRLEQIIDLLLVERCFQWHKQVWPTDVAVVLWNFVFENEMVSKGVPGQL